jgi:hypothetical protein
MTQATGQYPQSLHRSPTRRASRADDESLDNPVRLGRNDDAPSGVRLPTTTKAGAAPAVERRATRRVEAFRTGGANATATEGPQRATEDPVGLAVCAQVGADLFWRRSSMLAVVRSFLRSGLAPAPMIIDTREGERGGAASRSALHRSGWTIAVSRQRMGAGPGRWHSAGRLAATPSRLRENSAESRSSEVCDGQSRSRIYWCRPGLFGIRPGHAFCRSRVRKPTLYPLSYGGRAIRLGEGSAHVSDCLRPSWGTLRFWCTCGR